YRKATPRGALLTVILGAVAGIVLNSLPSVFSWEMATLIETFICLVIFFGSSLSPGGSPAYQSRVSDFFRRLKTRIVSPPVIEPGFYNALTTLYVTSLAASGILFIGMGLPAISEPSGALSVASGLVC